LSSTHQKELDRRAVFLFSARSFGPALMAGVWNHHWIYWVGPVLGASLGAWFYQNIRLPGNEMTIEPLKEASTTTQPQTGD
jgi:hypothetical protein